MLGMERRRSSAGALSGCRAQPLLSRWAPLSLALCVLSASLARAAFFDEHMQSILNTADQHEYTRRLHEVLRKVQDDVETFAASGQGTSEYLQWRRSLEEAGKLSRNTEGGARRRLEVLDGSSGTAALQPPALNSAPGEADMNITWFRHDSVNYNDLVDWRGTPAVNTPVFDQRACESCWLWAAADIISIKWSLLNYFTTPVLLSPQHVCDCGYKKCCGGGWPEWTFLFAKGNKGVAPLSVYPYLAKDNQKCGAVNASLLTGGITGWEKLPAASPEKLKKTIAQHPAVVLIYASPSFRTYRGGIFYGLDCGKKVTVNHALVVMGFNLTGPTPYWIAKNSWGTGWGEAGYIRISAASKLVCGFGSEPSLYPTMFHVKTPCDARPQPCGAGECYMTTDLRMARCRCPPGYVEKIERVPKCIIATPCNAAVNPCAFGSCTNGFDGSYTCWCPPGTVIGKRADGAETCIVNTFQSGLMTTTGVAGDNATTIAATYNITQQQLVAMNPFLNTSEALVPGTVVVVGGPLSGVGCGATDIVGVNDTCNSIAARSNLTVSKLTIINPGINCSLLLLSQHVCTTPGQVTKSSPYERSCGLSYQTDIDDTCFTVADQFNTSTVILEWLNPGLDCLRDLPISTLCVAPLLYGMMGLSCDTYYAVTQADTCYTVAASSGLLLEDFITLNPGIQCLSQWFIGTTVCINGTYIPASNLSVAANFRPYYIRTNDTLAKIAAKFDDCQSLNGSVVAPAELMTSICWSNGWLPADCSDRRVAVGTLILVPCMHNIGVVPCNLATSVAMDFSTVDSSAWTFYMSNFNPVCGNNFITYITDSCASADAATPTFSSKPCPACNSWCKGKSGLSLSSVWGTPPSGCSGSTVCTFPYAPSSATSSQQCAAQGGATAVCQYSRKLCSMATDTVGIADGGCRMFRKCLTQQMAFRDPAWPWNATSPVVGCPYTEKLSCGWKGALEPWNMASCNI